MATQEDHFFTLQELEDLIEPNIISEKSKILDVKYSRLERPENKNGSIFLTLQVNLVNSTTGEDFVMSLVAKTLPEPTKCRDLNQIHKGFTNEIGIYMSAKPAMEVFLREKAIRNGADFFPTPFGGRINSNGNKHNVDHNAVLILQNYNIFGFTTPSPRTGCDLDTANLFLKALAKFHGSFFGLKIHNPKEFNEKVKLYLTNNVNINEDLERIAMTHMVQVLKEKGTSENVIERAVATFNRKDNEEIREPFSTFIHNSASVNNIMVRPDKHGKPEYVKLLDFSNAGYGCHLRDLLFFLFSSVELGILKTCLDDLLDCYYYFFIGILKRVGITEKKLFCRLAFNRLLKIAASQSQFYKLMCMLYPVLSVKSLKCENVGDNIPELQDTLHKQRISYIVREFDRRGWLCV